MATPTGPCSGPSGAACSPPARPCAGTEAAAAAHACFYRRPLPAPGIAFASPEGKAIFAECLHEGTLDAYFPLSAVFTTQSEPAFCGLGSLSMVLNALEIDPGRHWKGPWRWFDDYLLDCCLPLDVVKVKGVSFDQLACLALCNGASIVSARHADPQPDAVDGARGEAGEEEEEEGLEEEGLAELRRAVLESTTTAPPDAPRFIIASYSRAVLNQTGSGHFSPIGAYNKARDMVLMLDVARFKLPPHWVPLRTLWAAMQTRDSETGQYRGYMVLSKPSAADALAPPTAVTISAEAIVSWPAILRFMQGEFVDRIREQTGEAGGTAMPEGGPAPPPAATSAAALTAAVCALPAWINESIRTYWSVLGEPRLQDEHRASILNKLEDLRRTDACAAVCGVFRSLEFDPETRLYRRKPAASGGDPPQTTCPCTAATDAGCGAPAAPAAASTPGAGVVSVLCTALESCGLSEQDLIVFVFLLAWPRHPPPIAAMFETLRAGLARGPFAEEVSRLGHQMQVLCAQLAPAAGGDGCA